MITNHLKDDTTSRYNSSGNVQNVKLSTERLFGVYCHGLFSSVNQKERWPWAGKSSEIKSTSETFSALKMPKDIPCTPHIVCLEVICWLQKSPKAGTRDLLKHPRTSSDGCTNKFPYILTMLPLYNQHFLAQFCLLLPHSIWPSNIWRHLRLISFQCYQISWTSSWRNWIRPLFAKSFWISTCTQIMLVSHVIQPIDKQELIHVQCWPCLCNVFRVPLESVPHGTVPQKKSACVLVMIKPTGLNWL